MCDLGSLEAGFLGGHLVGQVGGILGKGLLVIRQGFIPLFLFLVYPPLGQIAVALLGAGLQGGHRPKQRGGQQDSG